MPTQLEIYNEALRRMGERKLANLSENREPRRVLDDAYADTVRYCLQQGFWNFATRSVSISKSNTLTPIIGFQYAFAKPDDWLRTYVVAMDGRFTAPFYEFRDEGGQWNANTDPLFVKYISNDDDYGLDLDKWPPNFGEYVSLELASRTCVRITQSEGKKDKIDEDLKEAKMNAKATDAMDDPPGQIPNGTWVRARRGGLANGRPFR